MLMFVVLLLHEASLFILHLQLHVVEIAVNIEI